MLSASGPKPLAPFGQGKRATTLLTEGGYIYPIIRHDSYTDHINRCRSAPMGTRKGSRPMHRTTLVISKPPWVPETAYTTTSKENFSGSKHLSPVRRPPLCPSMHTSQIKLGRPQQQDPDVWKSHYTGTYIEKPIIPRPRRVWQKANRLHLTSLVNRIDQTEGSGMKNVVKVSTEPSINWSQYTRVHNKLGQMLGTGVQREYPVRQVYNVITGEVSGPAWQAENRRVSGNRVLNCIRKERTSLLG